MKTLKKIISAAAAIGMALTMSAAFAGCKNITSVTIGKNVKTIGKKAFYNCKKLKSVTVKNKAKLNKVGSKAFQKTAKKISIKLPKNLKKNKKISCSF